MDSITSYNHGNATQIFMGIIKVFVASLILLIGFLIFKLFSFFLPSLLSLIVLSYLLFKFIIFVCRTFTFPGSAWFWKRNNENHFRKAFVFKIKRRISALRNLIEYILEARLWHNFLNETELSQIRRVITSILNLYTKQSMSGTLSKKQKEMMNVFTEIETLFHETNLSNKTNQKTFSVWKLLQAERNITEDLEKPNCVLCFVDKAQGTTLLNKCKELEKKLNDIICEKSTIQKIKRWMYDDSFGSLDQLRVEIDNKYKSQRILLNVEKNVTIDCMLIYGKVSDDNTHLVVVENPDFRDKLSISNTNRQEHSHDTLHSASMRSKSNPVIIMCCPNAGYYECMHYENDWIDFYIKNGLHIFLWNYRGYGRSTGSPSPNTLRNDGEAIVDYLRDKLNITKIGIHGESIGGLVAIHVAKKKNLDFLCADRTFMNLSNVGMFSFGTILAKFYQLITLWDSNISSDYIQSTCYKIITFDPKDEVIHSLSSLKYGVTKKVLEGRLGLYGEPEKPCSTKSSSFLSNKFTHPIHQIIFSMRFCLYERKANNQLKDYYRLLGKEQMIALFWTLHRIAELFSELSSSHGFSALKQNARTYKPMNPRAQSNNLKSVQVVSSEIESPHAMSENHDGLDEGSTPVNGTQLVNKRDVTEEKISLNNHERAIHQTVEIKGFDYQDDTLLMKFTQKKCYLDRFNEESKTSDHVITLLLRLFPVFEELEAGGIQFTDIISLKNEHQYEFFRFYIQCFDIWGSYIPLFKTIEEEGKDLTFHQNLAIGKIHRFLTKIENIVKKYERRDSSINLTNDIMDDLVLIQSMFSLIYNKLTEKANKNILTLNSKVLNDLEGQDEITVQNVTLNDRGKTKGGKLIQDKDKIKDTLEDRVDLATSSSIGHLIPLTCGHNGSYKLHEMEFYEYHLKNSKFLER